MKKYYSTLILIVCYGISVAHAEPNLEHGKKVYNRSCFLCHGKQGEKPAMGQSKIINGLAKNEIITALQDRKSGKIDGGGNRAKASLSEQDMQDLAEYIETLNKQ